MRRSDRASGARDDRGVVLVVTALVVIALLTIVALVVDLGHAKQLRREVQGAADSAALAAGQVLADGGNLAEAAASARRYAALSSDGLSDDAATWAACTDPARPAGFVPAAPTLTGECVSVDAARGLVRVVLPDVDSPSFFGAVIGRGPYEISAAAEATFASGVAAYADCGICGIDGALLQQANGNIKIEGGREIQADRLRIDANHNANEPKTAAYYVSEDGNNRKYTYRKLNAPVPNPFESVTVDYAGVTMHPEMNARCEHLEPWRMYRQTVNIDSSCTLPGDGMYFFRNGINVSGTLKAPAGSKVTLVFGCATGTEVTDRPQPCNGRHTGNVNISGGLQLGEPYHGGVSLLWDPTASGESVINYNGNVKLGGAYYSKGAAPAFGNGTFEATAIVFGGAGNTATVNGGNIRIIDPPAGPPGTGGSRPQVALWR